MAALHLNHHHHSISISTGVLQLNTRNKHSASFLPCHINFRVSASSFLNVDQPSSSNYIPAAPILLPEGPWKQVPGGVTAAKGFKAAGLYGGLRAKGEKPDLALVTCDVDAVAAGAFTTNVVAAAPVIYCKQRLDNSNSARAVLINAGQANAATGDAGYQDVIECAAAVSKLLQLRPEEVLIESTGVIGQRIKKEALLNALPKLVDSLSSTIEGADSAAVAITTTDLVSKSVAIESEVGGSLIRVGGMAKGSGMIHPNMATLLGVITTDALVTSDLWKNMVLTAVNRSFNQITARAVLINAGQANAATGDAGYQDVIECAAAVSKLLQLRPEEVLIESTGVIGQRIKKEALLNALPKLVDSLSSTIEGADSAAVAITTTDLVSKSVAIESEVGGSLIRVGGMAKGSGMIHPNMATLLGVITTDALVTSDLWKNMVLTAVNRSFNQITARAVLINAGQANAATGDAGYQDVIECAAAVSKLLQLRPEEVLIESTGVIGQRIKKEALLNALPKLVDSLSSTIEGADSAAVAITTTDLVSKSVAIESEVGGSLIRVGGMAKGSGMIHPNMATLLGVITTDALVTSDLWKNMVLTAVNRSFNQITVDGDTSTNDTVIALASGVSGSTRISSSTSYEARQLQACLDAVMQGLAKSIAWDGEGATCLIEVTVTGANNEAEASKIARSVATSSLTKAAIYGRDPNWGRIACAAGYAGIPFHPNDLRISLGDIMLMDKGQPLPFDRGEASGYLKKAGETHGTVEICLSIGNGEGRGQAWGCDLSYDYVKINAEYTT